MNGSDHERPQPFLGRLIAEANGIQDEFEFHISSLVGIPRRDERP